MYPSLINLRSLEADVGWKRNLFFAGYQVLIIPVANVLSPETLKFLAVSVASVGMSVLWLRSASRSKLMMGFWNGRGRALEEHEFTPVPIFSSNEFRRIERGRGRNQNIFLGLILTLVVTWILVFGYSAWHQDWLFRLLSNIRSYI